MQFNQIRYFLNLADTLNFTSSRSPSSAMLERKRNTTTRGQK